MQFVFCSSLFIRYIYIHIPFATFAVVVSLIYRFVFVLFLSLSLCQSPAACFGDSVHRLQVARPIISSSLRYIHCGLSVVVFFTVCFVCLV